MNFIRTTIPETPDDLYQVDSAVGSLFFSDKHNAIKLFYALKTEARFFTKINNQFQLVRYK